MQPFRRARNLSTSSSTSQNDPASRTPQRTPQLQPQAQSRVFENIVIEDGVLGDDEASVNEWRFKSGSPVSNSDMQMRTPLDMRRKELKDISKLLANSARCFPARSVDIQPLSSPADFYKTILQLIGAATQRIEICTFYLGSGDLTSNLVDAIAARSNQPNLRVKFVLDSFRGQRGGPVKPPKPDVQSPTSDPSDPIDNGFRSGKSSTAMLTPLFNRFDEDKIDITLVKAYEASWLQKFMFRGKLRELVGVLHAKVYIFDDNVILTGANLSESYFTNRQDRAVLFRNNPALVQFYSELFSIISNSSAATRFIPPNRPAPQSPISQPITTDLSQAIYAHFKPIAGKSSNSTGAGEEKTPPHPAATPMVVAMTMDSKPLPAVNLSSAVVESGASPSPTTVRGSVGGDSKSPSFSLTDSPRTMKNRRYSFVEDEKDTLIFPTFQWSHQHVTHDQDVISNIVHWLQIRSDRARPSFSSPLTVPGSPLLQPSPSGFISAALANASAYQLDISTGYFNVPGAFAKHLTSCVRPLSSKLRASESSYGIRMTIYAASQEAHGWFGSKGVEGLVPQVYSAIMYRFLKSVRHLNEPHADPDKRQFAVLEYARDHWTYHVKGIWLTFPWDPMPFVTVVGSSNFGYRSRDRDIESNVVVVTSSEQLAQQFQQELTNLKPHTKAVSAEDYEIVRKEKPGFMEATRVWARSLFVRLLSELTTSYL